MNTGQPETHQSSPSETIHMYDPPDGLMDSRLVLLSAISFIMLTVAGGEPAGLHARVNAVGPQGRTGTGKRRQRRTLGQKGHLRKKLLSGRWAWPRRGWSMRVENCPTSFHPGHPGRAVRGCYAQEKRRLSGQRMLD